MRAKLSGSYSGCVCAYNTRGNKKRQLGQASDSRLANIYTNSHIFFLNLKLVNLGKLKREPWNSTGMTMEAHLLRRTFAAKKKAGGADAGFLFKCLDTSSHTQKETALSIHKKNPSQFLPSQDRIKLNQETDRRVLCFLYTRKPYPGSQQWQLLIVTPSPGSSYLRHKFLQFQLLQKFAFFVLRINFLMHISLN